MFTLPRERRCPIQALWLSMGLAKWPGLSREVWDGEWGPSGQSTWPMTDRKCHAAAFLVKCKLLKLGSISMQTGLSWTRGTEDSCMTMASEGRPGRQWLAASTSVVMEPGRASALCSGCSDGSWDLCMRSLFNFVTLFRAQNLITFCSFSLCWS